jgi:hypothetical protein
VTLFGKILYQIDVFISGLIFWANTDISISAHAGVELAHATPASPAPIWARAVSDVCNLVQKNHCELARQSDIALAKAAIVKLGGTV